MPNENQETKVRDWLRQAPFDDPAALAARPTFSYDDWFAEGRKVPGAVKVLTGLLNKEDLERPSGEGERLAYALGGLGDPSAAAVLTRALASRDVALRAEAAAALGRLGVRQAAPALTRLVEDDKEDVNVRANACIALGRLAAPGTEALLRRLRGSPDSFLDRAAAEGLALIK